MQSGFVLLESRKLQNLDGMNDVSQPQIVLCDSR
jgi:hypothetical protein